MERFLLIVREDVKKLASSSPSLIAANIAEMTKWVEELALTGNYVTGDPLLHFGKYVSKDQLISDGPFIEAKESVSGYIIINAENLDQAASIAQTCPKVIKGELSLEVRPIMKMNE